VIRQGVVARTLEELSLSENRRIILWERPRYIVPTANCFRLDATTIPAIADGELRIRTLWLGMDSILYSKVQRVSAQQGDPVKLKDVMVGPAVGRVDDSRNPDFRKGDLVSGFWGWQDYVVSTGRRLRKLDFGIQKVSYALGAYGVPGFAAYVALEKLAPPLPNETVVVGTALGGLGQTAGQIAKLKGCRVVGIAGTPEKCRIAVETLGFDACVDHESKDFARALMGACPKGIDVYVETIGGRALDAVVPLLNLNARIAACGLMGTPHFGESAFKGRYQNTMDLMYEIINRRLSIRGLVVFDHLRDKLQEFQRDMKGWIDSGAVRPLEDVVEGLEAAPAAFQEIFEGRNLGKRVIHVAD
jgi:NADPH-dependent curcumin reductase